MEYERRCLIMQVADDNARAFKYLYQFDRLVHAKHFYRWLIANKVTGQVFVDHYEKVFKFSFLSFVKYILSKMNHHPEIYYGKDYV